MEKHWREGKHWRKSKRQHMNRKHLVKSVCVCVCVCVADKESLEKTTNLEDMTWGITHGHKFRDDDTDFAESCTLN